MQQRSSLFLLTAGVACLLAAGCSSTPFQASPPPSTAPLAAMVGAPTDADAVFQELIAFVETARGVTFEQPPALRVVGPGEAAFAEAADGDEWLRIDTSRYQALGVLDPDGPSDPCLPDGEGCDVLGYYDSVPDELVVSSTADGWGPAVRATIVHELVHAVQERRGDLARWDKIWRRDLEAADVFEALLEGEATLVENLYLDSLTARARWLRWDEQVALAGTELSDPVPYFDYVSYYPYDEGARAVTDAYRAGGWRGVDALMADPSPTTEALEYPEAPASAHEVVIEMPNLAVEGFEFIEDGRWGKNDFDGYLLNALPLDEPTGWGDDWYEVYWNGTTAVTVHLLRGDDAAATDRLADALLHLCRARGLGDGFSVLREGPDLAFVASLDPVVTTRFHSQLAEQGFVTAGAC